MLFFWNGLWNIISEEITNGGTNHCGQCTKGASVAPSGDLLHAVYVFVSLCSSLLPSEILWDCVRVAAACICLSCIRSLKRIYQPAVVEVWRISRMTLNMLRTRQSGFGAAEGP